MNRIVRKSITLVMFLALGCSILLVGNPLALGEGAAPVTDDATSSLEGLLPRLVDLGAKKCIPCKKMKPILDQLREEYRGRMEVVFIDVWENPEEAKSYGIQSIPTQIFYDAKGKEQARHEGFISREDIMAQWKEMGVVFNPPKSAVSPANSLVDQKFPGLASGVLTYARLGQLPDGVLLQAGTVKITAAELQKIIDCAPEKMREQFRKNKFFLLEQDTTEKILLTLARLELNRTKADSAGRPDKELILNFTQDAVTAKISVSEAEITEYYEKNKGMCGTATFEEAKSELKEYALQEKQQKALNDYIQTLGKRIPIVLSEPWVKEQVKLARDNPVDKARVSGKPSVVDFGAVGCVPCDKMAPILKAMKEKYTGKVNVLFVHVREENILAERYGVQSIPVQVFFDRNGKEIYRHLGFFPQEEIEKRLKEMGVK